MRVLIVNNINYYKNSFHFTFWFHQKNSNNKIRTEIKYHINF